MEDLVKRFSEDTKPKVTIKDVAKLSGVSVSSVSNVINKTKYVSPIIVQKVEKAIKDLNYHPNPAAKTLRNGKSWLIGFVVANLENSFYVRIAKGIEKVINPQGYNLLLMDSAENSEIERHNIESLSMRGLEGLIIAPTSSNCTYIPSLLPPKFPLVFVDREPRIPIADTILLSNNAASKKATNSLIHRGRKRIAFIGMHFGDENIDKTMLERIEGYKQALISNGIDIDDSLIRVIQGSPFAMAELQYSDTYYITEELLENNIDAILCGNDLAAIGVFTCLKVKKIKIPEEVALITFDDSLWLTTATPEISALVQPAEKIGIFAGERLLKQLNGDFTKPTIFRLNAELVIRESS